MNLQTHNSIVFLVLCVIFSGVIIFLEDPIFHAYAESDLTVIDVVIEDVEIKPLTKTNSSNLIKISLIFENEGERNYSMGSGNISLIYAKPQTQPEDIDPDFKDVTIKRIEPTDYFKLEFFYKDTSNFEDCKRVKLFLQPDDKKRGLVCFEVDQSKSLIEKSISDEQYFFKIDANKLGSTCPNCVIISLNDISELDGSENANIKGGFEKDEFAEKKLIVNQECNQRNLHIKVTNQDNVPREGAAITSRDKGKTHAMTDQNGIAVITPDKQGQLVKIVSGSYVPILITTETCSNGSSEIANETKQSEVKPDKQKIPEWIRNNAGWWANDQIDDTAFIQGIEFLIKNNIIEVQETETDSLEKSNDIPLWVKNNADWWSQELISDGDFLKGIQYLVSSGIINFE